MIKRFISLEWKQFSRSSSFKMGIAMKILLVFFALYFIVSFLILGVGAYFILEEALPGKDPLKIVCEYIIVWFVFDLLFRFFMQKLPVMNVRPLMTFPIKRNIVIRYLIGKTMVSFFNFLPLFFFIPFTIVLLIKGHGYMSILWFLAMLGFTFINNFLNFLLQKNNIVFYSVISVFIILFALSWWNIFNIFPYAERFFYAMYEYPFAFLLPLAFVFALYRLVFNFLRRNFYLDEAIKKKTTEAQTMELGFLDRFGKLSTFLKNDIRMIWRNARPKQVLWTSFLFLFYGLFFFTQKSYQNNPVFLTFVSMFITAGFLMTFGQLVPSWDSQY